MQKRIGDIKENRRRSDVYGKQACLSFAAHELYLMDEWEKLAESEYLTKSGYFKRFIRAEARKLKEQSMTDWSTLLGNK